MNVKICDICGANDNEVNVFRIQILQVEKYKKGIKSRTIQGVDLCEKDLERFELVISVFLTTKTK